MYKELHTRMQQGGFFQTINGITSTGRPVTASLPHATYYGEANWTANEVRDWAQESTKETWSRSIIFVAETNTWARGES